MYVHCQACLTLLLDRFSFCFEGCLTRVHTQQFHTSMKNQSHWGPSIKYVTLFLANFYPLFLSHFITHPGTPKVRHTSRDPPIFSRPSTKNSDKSPLYKFSLNCLRGFCPGGFVRGSLVWKVLSGVVFVHSFFCHNTSVTTES